MRINYVLIDYESVQPKSLSLLNEDHFHIKLFVGASQTKLSYEVASAVQAFGSRADYIKISGNGPNALDFHIAYYIGRLAAQDANAYFHIISKDTGFDPLIQHLKEQKIPVVRSPAIEDIPLLKVPNSNTFEEKLTAIVTNLKPRGASKPRAVKTLKGTISSLFQKKLEEAEINKLLQTLQERGYLSVTGSKVSYALPD